MHGELRGIEDDIGNVSYRVEAPALCTDGLHDGVGATHGMRAAGLGESSDESFVTRLKIEDAGRQDSPDLLQDRGKILEPHSLAHINDQGSTFNLSRLPNQICELRNEVKRKIVDGVETEIFECFK